MCKLGLCACSSVDRALGCGPRDRRFEPCQAYHFSPWAGCLAPLLCASRPAPDSERCQSGRLGRSRKPLRVHALPGFESQPLRPPLNPPRGTWHAMAASDVGARSRRAALRITYPFREGDDAADRAGRQSPARRARPYGRRGRVARPSARDWRSRRRVTVSWVRIPPSPPPSVPPGDPARDYSDWRWRVRLR